MEGSAWPLALMALGAGTGGVVWFYLTSPWKPGQVRSCLIHIHSVVRGTGLHTYWRCPKCGARGVYPGRPNGQPVDDQWVSSGVWWSDTARPPRLLRKEVQLPYDMVSAFGPDTSRWLRPGSFVMGAGRNAVYVRNERWLVGDNTGEATAEYLAGRAFASAAFPKPKPEYIRGM